MKPKRIQLSIKCKCQFKCNFCAYDGSVDEMTMEEFKELVDRFYDFGVRDFELTPTTGESFLDDLLLDKILYLNSLNVNKIIFFTNLYQINYNLLEKINDISSVEINLSLYGANRKQFENRTGVDGFLSVVDNLRKLIIRDRHSKNTIVIHKRFSMIRITSNLNVILRVANENNIKIWECPDDTPWLDMVKCNLNVYKPINNGVCRFALEDNGVYSNGDISLCGWFDVEKKMVIGNVYEQTLDEIYGDGGEFDSIIKNQKEGIYKNLCCRCSMKNVQ